MREFIAALPRHALLADVGCGNGKYFGVRPDLVMLASDRSPNLAEAAADRCSPPYLNDEVMPCPVLASSHYFAAWVSPACSAWQ